MEVRDEYVADTRQYSGPLREAGKEADRFADKNGRAALAARKMGLAAKEAADKAAKSMALAGEAAEKLAEGEIEAKEAAEAESRALKDMERAAIAAAEAERAVARAANDAADNMRKAARDAEMAGAAQKLAALKAAGATKQHNAEVLRLRKEMPELEKVSAGAFSLMESASSKFGSALDGVTSSMSELSGMGRALPGLIITGLELLPAAAAAAGGAITLGLGGAIAGVGILAASKNKEIRAEYASLGKDIFGHLQQDAQPFVATLAHIGTYLEDEAKSWAPLIKGAFAEMAPEVDQFAKLAIKSLNQLKPAFSAITKGFGVQLQSLGPELAPSLHNIATGVQAIGDAAAKNPDALPELAHDLSLVVRVGGDVIGFFTRFEGYINRASEMTTAYAFGPLGTLGLEMYKLKNIVGSWLGSGGKQTEMFADISTGATGSAGALTQTRMATERYKSANDLAALSTDKFITALNNLAAANMSLDQAQIAQAQAANAASSAADHHHHVSLSERSALLSVAQANQTLLEKMKESGASTDSVAHKMGTLRAGFIATAEKMGYTASQAKKLADRYGLLPARKNTKVTADTRGAMSNLDAFLARVRNARPVLSVDVRYNGKRPDLAATGGQYMGPGKGFKYAAGGEVSGLINGPGTGTSDSIPAPWLSNGEFVVNSKTTADNTAALMNLNAGMSWMRAGLLGGERFAKGGKVSIGKGEQKQIAKLHAAQARVSLARSRPEYLAALAAQQALESMRRSVYGGILRGGPGGPGTSGSTVVQHVTQIDVHVAGNVWQTTQLAQELQSVFLRNGMPLALQAGR